MTVPQQRPGLAGIIQDHHSRIRRLEASPGGGGDPGFCPDCVLQPYTVNPGAIEVPPEYWGCVDVTGWGYSQPNPECGTDGPNFIIGPEPVGFCSSFLLGTPLKLRIRGNISALPGALENFCVWLGANGSLDSAVYCKTYSLPDEFPGEVGFDYLTDAEGVCGVGCDELFVGLSFFAGPVFESCATGTLSIQLVEVDEDGEYRGALDDLPDGEAYGDTIHFNSETHEWNTGPRSIPSRAISTFMGG